MLEKLKSLLLDDVVFYGLLILTIAIIAFGLGRQSVSGVSQTAAGVQVLQSETKKNIVENGIVVVASRSGTKYHLPNCPGASQIKPENRLEFSSIAAAKAAGYGPAANCDGL